MIPAGVRHGLLTGGAALLAPEALYAQPAEPDVAVEATYTVDLLSNLAGGVRTDTRLMGLLDVVADIDGEAAGLDGVRFHLDAQFVHGGGFSESVVGDAQGVSNIDAPRGLRPLEAYAALALGTEGAGEIKAGLIDLNGIFDVQEVGGHFIHSSHGIGPDFSQSGLNGPSIFPTTATAVTIEWNAEGWAARAGLFDAVAGDPDHPRRTVIRFPGESGLLLVGEIELDLGESASAQFGGWGYTSRFDAIDRPERLAGNSGVYGMVEATLARRGESALDGWVRIGAARAAINPIGAYLGGGLAYGHDDGRIGVAVAHARLGDPAIRGGLASGSRPDRAETAIELSYAHRVSDWLTLQPDLQYVVNPGWDRSRDDAFVAGVRVQFTLN